MKSHLNTEFEIEIDEAPDNISVLFSDLVDNPDPDTSYWTRELLVRLGSTVLPELNIMLASDNKIIRKEVIEIIIQINHPSSIPVLIDSLEDPEYEIRWIATSGLINIGKKCLKPLLKRLTGNNISNHLKFSSHQILTALVSVPEKKEIRHLVNLLKHGMDTTSPIYLLPSGFDI